MRHRVTKLTHSLFNFLACLGLGATMVFTAVGVSSAADGKDLTLIVMDPLASPLACECVEGYAQRRYEVLARYLERKLGRPVQLVFNEDLVSAVQQQTQGKVDLIIGKDSVVRYDAAQLKRKIKPLAALSGKDGSTKQHGLFVVPGDDPAKTLSDLKGYTILFGPFEAEEKHAAALAALVKAKVALPSADKLETREACSEGACDILDEDAPPRAAAVLSSYAKPLLEGCGTIDKGALKVVGRTADVPFITAYATDSIDEAAAQRIQTALLAVAATPDLCVALETLDGFVALKAEKKK